MPRVEPFEKHLDRYETWFSRHRFAYESELEATRALLPVGGKRLEIGVGTGRFAAPLDVQVGLEPSRAMGPVARHRGVVVVAGVAEALPFADRCFDHALMVTTICFVDDLEVAVREARRVLKPRGSLVVGFVDRKSPLGRAYHEHKDDSVFYRVATFYSSDEVASHLRAADFRDLAFAQTIFRHLGSIRAIEPVRPGHGEGAFVVVRGVKPDDGF